MKNATPDSDQPNYRAKRSRPRADSITIRDRILIGLLATVAALSFITVVIQSISLKHKERDIADLQARNSKLSEEIRTSEAEVVRLQAALELEKKRGGLDGGKDREAK